MRKYSEPIVRTGTRPSSGFGTIGPRKDGARLNLAARPPSIHQQGGPIELKDVVHHTVRGQRRRQQVRVWRILKHLDRGGCWPRSAQAAKPMPLTPRLDDPVGAESSTTSPQLTTALAADPEDQAAQQPDDPDPVPGYKISG